MEMDERLDKVCTDVAILAAQVGEMSKRLDDQVTSIQTLNDNHTTLEVSMTRLEGKQDSFANMIKWGGAAITIFLTVVSIVVNLATWYFGG